jgi:hypothetical protein
LPLLKLMTCTCCSWKPRWVMGNSFQGKPLVGKLTLPHLPLQRTSVALASGKPRGVLLLSFRRQVVPAALIHVSVWPCASCAGACWWQSARS